MELNNNNNAVNTNVVNPPNMHAQPRRTLRSYNAPSPDLYGNSILLLLPFTVGDQVKQWLDTQPKESLDTWDKVVNKFLTKFFPPQRLTKLKTDIQTFRKREGESFYRAWERYKLMLRKCPPDMFSDWIQFSIFYDGVFETTKMSLDNSSGGSLHMKKTPNEAIELIEMVANNQYLYSCERTSVKKRVIELDALDAILAQNKAMSQQINAITQHLSGMQVLAVNAQDTSYDMSGGFPQSESYEYGQFTSEQVNFMGNSSRPSNNDPFSKTYNQVWRNHPNFG
ncbi:uncharacterized protein LOC110269237 [Arachis ipaensis]|uniref:uncharacterized protein LOC110269237 n=1 Tax=Arachis ipaensis TaxID=130454 RepID=UPI000A2B777A|nr:uncharacterized protein LOC110269237 [Arachis ipaensis]XP_025636046.1 uncharacterized protein LOC112730160 [Arachis hypogaea]